MTSSSNITKSGGISSVLDDILGGPGPCSGNSGSEHNDDISEKLLSPFICDSYDGLFLPSLVR